MRDPVLTHPTLDQLPQVGLAGMARAYEELTANPRGGELDHAEWLGLLPHTASRRQDLASHDGSPPRGCLWLTVAPNAPREGLSPPIQCPCQAPLQLGYALPPSLKTRHSATNPAGTHLSFAGNCSDERGQLRTRRSAPPPAPPG